MTRKTGMSPFLVAAALAATLLAAPASADKPQVRPYAAGSPSGGIPLWNPGREVRRDRRRRVLAEPARCTSCTCSTTAAWSSWARSSPARPACGSKQMDPNVYAELLTTVVRTGVLDGDIKRGTCLKDRPMLTVMRSEPDGQSMRMQLLNSGCGGHADFAHDIEKQFIDWTEIAPWLAPHQVKMGGELLESVTANPGMSSLFGLHLSWDTASPESRRSTRTACRWPWQHFPPPRNSALRTPSRNRSCRRWRTRSAGSRRTSVALAAHCRRAGAPHEIAVIARRDVVHGAARLGLDVVRDLGDHVDGQAVELRAASRTAFSLGAV